MTNRLLYFQSPPHCEVDKEENVTKQPRTIHRVQRTEAIPTELCDLQRSYRENDRLPHPGATWCRDLAVSLVKYAHKHSQTDGE